MSKSAPYRKGADFERRVRKYLESRGAFVIRSAGSKGVFDLIAIFPDGTIWGVQCKRSFSLSKSELEHILSIVNRYPIDPILATRNGRKIDFIDIRKIEKYKYQNNRHNNG